MVRINIMDKEEIKTKRQAQIELIDSIKEQVAKMEDRTIDGFDLALDIIDLLKNIKPTI